VLSESWGPVWYLWVTHVHAVVVAVIEKRDSQVAVREPREGDRPGAAENGQRRVDRQQ